MASTFTDLGLELMATGENAGTWGTKTNANLSLVEQLTGGYLSLAVAGSGTTALTIAEGALTGTAQQRVIELTGALTGSRILTVPLLTENFYFIKNSTTNAETLQLKAVSGSGATVTWATTDKGWKIIYVDGVATNTGVYEIPMTSADDVTLTGTQTLTNKTLTAPKIGTSILDTSGNELLLLTATGSAVNEFTLANAASGAGPTLSSTGETNVDINIIPKGTGDVVLAGDTVKVGDSGAAAVLTSNGAGTLTVTTGGATDLILNTNGGTNSGNITITDAANSDMNASPDGYGRFIINGQGAIQSLTEKVNIDTGSGPSGTFPFDVLTSAVIYTTQGAAADWTLNVRGNASTSINTIMDTGETLTIAHLATITGSEYRMTQLQIDGSNITPEWQGGTAPSEGNTNSVDVYTFTIIKTANATFTALAALTQFA